MSHPTEAKPASIGTGPMEAVCRLVAEAGKYLGVAPGEWLPVEELRQQAEANGYRSDEIDRLFADAGVRGVDTVRIPGEGARSNSLWQPVEGTAGVPSPNPPQPEGDALDRFRAWLQEKVDADDTRHSYSRRKADQQFARAKDVDRWFVREYDTFSTVLITYTLPRQDGESIAEHANGFYPRSMTRNRRRLLKQQGVYEEYAGVALLAPKHAPETEHRVPQANPPPESGITHAHTFLWLPSTIPESDFWGLANVTKAEVHVSLETHVSSEVTTPDEVSKRGSGMDAQRGATTALPQEVGNNLPLLQTRLDARGLPEYAENWCARMRLGADDSLDTKGFHCFRTLGRFGKLADAVRWHRQLGRGIRNGTALQAEMVEGGETALLHDS